MRFETLALELEPKHLIILVGIGVVGLLIVAHTCGDVLKTRARERTRREIAAYVAEGSIDPEQARRLMGAEASDVEKKIADAVAWGVLSSSKAESLIRTLREDRERRDAEPT